MLTDIIGRFQKTLTAWRAARKVFRYDRKYRSKTPLSEQPESVHVEEAFDAFVEEFSGNKLSDLISTKTEMPLNADYIFKECNIIAELKTLEGIFSGPNAHRQFIKAYTEEGFSGSDVMGYLWRGEVMPKVVSARITKRVRRSLEQRISKARKQLKQSKATYGDSDTRCLILIAMDQTPLFRHQFMLHTIAKLMGDNYIDEHVDGIIYLNPNTPTRVRSDGLELAGWFPFYRDEQANDGLSEFVNLLGNRWLKFYGTLIGETKPIIELKSPEEMMAALRSQ